MVVHIDPLGYKLGYCTQQLLSRLLFGDVKGHPGLLAVLQSLDPPPPCSLALCDLIEKHAVDDINPALR